jgi:hypothetical protein
MKAIVEFLGSVFAQVRSAQVISPNTNRNQREEQIIAATKKKEFSW